MIKSREVYCFYCIEDEKALFFGKKPSLIEKIKNPIYRYQKVLRRCELYRNTLGYFSISYIIAKWKLRKMGFKLDIQISENTFGPGLRIAH